MTENLLRHEASPYLLQHRDNPVHWRPWGPAALAEARASNKPILLSVGYAACHWCHVMAHESFEDPATAAVMNRLFVNIKVDREERPEIDQIYMAALHALGEQGGWPLTMFLTPAGEPVWGGTYFPRTARYGRPAFVDILEEVARLFREEPDKVARNGGYILEHLRSKRDRDPVPLGPELLDAAAARLSQFMDPARGGTAGAPKFPQASLLELLWRAGQRTGERNYRDLVLVTLRSLCQGGIYDHLGGGFARYSVDEHWLVPHFEKMLYDNAQILELLSFAYAATAEPLFRLRIEETADWLAREMLQPDGAFASSLDADSEGHEGRFYVWTPEEVRAVLAPADGALFCDAYNITPAGNFDGKSIPNRLATMAPLPPADETRLAALRGKLLAARAARIRPATDDKVLADWNGLAIAALALAGAVCARPEWTGMAERAFGFVDGIMRRGDRLAHSWRAGKSVFPGLATDYAAMIKAALALHTATLDPGWIDRAEALAAVLRRHHWDAETPGYFLAADDAEALIVRPRSTTDDATPSATSLMAQNLVRLWHLTGKEDYRRDVDAMLEASGAAAAANLFAATGIINALDLRLNAIDVAIVVTPGSDDPEGLLTTARAHLSPNLILSLHPTEAQLPAGHPAAGKTAVGGRPTAYVCRGDTCSLPVTDAEDLEAMLGV